MQVTPHDLHDPAAANSAATGLAPAWREARRIGRLAGPLILVQLSQMGIGLTDTLMAGRLGAADLAAVGLGTSLWIPVFLACIGLMSAVPPSVAQLHGAGRDAEIGPLFRQALWLGGLFGVAMLLLLRNLGAVLPAAGIDPAMIPIVRDYLAAVSWGLPGACLFLALRYVNEGTGRTRPLLLVQLAALGINAAADYVLMFGKLGAPALGAVGAAYATSIVQWLTAAMLLVYVALARPYRTLGLFARFDPPRRAPLGGLLCIGAPLAVIHVMEVGLFTTVALLMGRIGPLAVAAHQIALNYAAVMFMLPLGIALATTVQVGNCQGAGDREGARRAGLVGMTMAVAVMALSAGVMLAVPASIVGLYTQDPEVTRVALGLLFMAALFQVWDGLQVGALGALRGLKDTTLPLAITLVAFWLIGAPAAYGVGIGLGVGSQGLWLGLILGLGVNALLLTWRFLHLTRGG